MNNNKEASFITHSNFPIKAIDVHNKMWNSLPEETSEIGYDAVGYTTIYRLKNEILVVGPKDDKL